MPNSFYGDPQDSPNSEAQDTIGLLIGRYITDIETGTFVTKSWMGDCEKPQALITLDDGTQLLAVGRRRRLRVRPGGLLFH